MKKLLISLLLLLSLSSYSQIIVQAGLGAATSGIVNPISEVDLGWNFEKPFHGINYQATFGYTFNPYIDKTIYNVKVGAHVQDWTFKAGLGLVNSTYNVTRVIDRYPQEAVYVYDTYVSAYNTLILGVERYIPKWEGKRHKVYYGVDLIDGHFYGKIGFRFQYNVNPE